ncbi:hypothetical protein FB451DRAFT_362420 [Mycena latifolia]|nr:hypothetical protein FB451DRAFT_362420 [Mycena latifolia]
MYARADDSRESSPYRPTSPLAYASSPPAFERERDVAEPERQRRARLVSPAVEEEDGSSQRSITVSPVRAHRATALKASDNLAGYYASGGFLDSQTGDGTYVDNLCNEVYEPQSQSQEEDTEFSVLHEPQSQTQEEDTEPSDLYEPQSQTQEEDTEFSVFYEPQSQIQEEVNDFSVSQEENAPVDSDHELHVRIGLLKNQLAAALQERDDLKQERDEYRRRFEDANEKLREWKVAADSASALFNLARGSVN